MASLHARAFGAALVTTALAAVPWGCGARSGLPLPTEVTGAAPSAAFCARATYPSGYGELSIYVVLDQSGSMANDGKWDSVTAALGAFAEDPLVAGMGMGLVYFPLNDQCSDSKYATPSVPIGILPANAGGLRASLAAHMPNGETPTLPALRGAIEYARAALAASPTREVIIVLATDGDPDTCDSTADNVAAAAADGLNGSPHVRTAVIGIQHANAAALNEIAAAGGAGAPIPIGSGTNAAQEFIDALVKIRDDQTGCKFAVPPVGVPVKPSDLSATLVTSTSGSGSSPAALKQVIGASDCGSAGGFYVDDPTSPAYAILCAETCASAHASAGSTLEVTTGCGAGSSPTGTVDGGLSCDSIIGFTCVAACGISDPPIMPVCVGELWTCPAGTISTDECQQCQPVPHGCCMSNGTLADGSCIDGAWTCPPGGTLFGTGSCVSPGVCAATLPCPITDFCKVPDASCGLATTPGTCVAPPTSCPTGGPQACGCDGQTYANACSAQLVGVDVSAGGGCTTPKGTFSCGPFFCELADQICEKDATVTPATYACVPRAGACPTGCEPGCDICPACPMGKTCIPVCTSDGTNGGPTVTCQQI